MKLKFVAFSEGYFCLLILLSLLGFVVVVVSDVTAHEVLNDTSARDPDFIEKPSVGQFKQRISSSVADPPAPLREKNVPVKKTSGSVSVNNIASSPTTESPIATHGSPLPAAVLNQGTLSHQLAEPAAAVVRLGEDASSTLEQRAASQSLEATPKLSEDSNNTGARTDDALPSVILLPGSAEPPPVVRALPKVVTPNAPPETKPSDTPAQTTPAPEEADTPALPPVSQSAPSPPPPLEVPQEDIPSFSEWTQKQLEEAEKKKSENRTAVPGAGAKIRSKNYASPDCGAKVVATNPEAENPSGVLSISRDDYLINTCTTTRQWIVIELCEAIQAKKLELANLELFSSSPKEFSVSISRTFPTREWSSLGHFTAKDERTVQSFGLQPLLFGKFIRVDYHSHYGNEHFCCTTLIRVYGTSEFEVLETEEAEEEGGHGPPSLSEDEDEDDDDGDQALGGGKGSRTGRPSRPSKNLFGHATEAVFSIVKKAAAVLVKTSGAGAPAPQEKTEAPIQEKPDEALTCCTSPRHLVVCNNCSDETFDRVFQLLSCQRETLIGFAAAPWVRSTIGSLRVCSSLGLDVLNNLVAYTQKNITNGLRKRWEFLNALVSPEYIAAMCNVLAVEERKVAVNTSQVKVPLSSEALPSEPPASHLLDHLLPQTCSAEPSSSASSVPNSQPTSPPSRPDIRPTKTIKKEQSKDSVVLPEDQGLESDSVVTQSVPPSSHPLSSITSVPPGTAPSVPATSQLASDTLSSSIVTKVMERLPVGPEPSPALPPPPAAEPATKVETPVASPASSVEPVMPAAAAPAVNPPSGQTTPSAPVSAVEVDEAASEDENDSRLINNDLDAILTEMKTLEAQEEQAASSTPPTPRAAAAQGQKESVILRLSNKIKALDRNMSLSGQYLEELSRRYKKQEELGRTLNKSLAVLWEEARKARTREQQAGNDLGTLREQVNTLSAAVDLLLAERNSWKSRIEHSIIILIEMSIFGLILWSYRRVPTDSSVAAANRKWSTGWKRVNGQSPTPKPQIVNRTSCKRRNSVDGQSPTPPRKRRPSEEAISVSGSYKDLVRQDDELRPTQDPNQRVDSLVEGGNWMIVNRVESRRQQKRRRQRGLAKSSSTHNLVHLGSPTSSSGSFSSPSTRLTASDEKDPQRRISVPAKIALNARGESHSAREMDPAWPLNVSPPSYMQTAASARSRRSVTSIASAGDGTSVRQIPAAAPPEAPAEAETSGVAILPSQSDSLSQVTNRNGENDRSNSPCGSLSSRTASVLNIDSKKTKKRGLKSMVKKLF